MHVMDRPSVGRPGRPHHGAFAWLTDHILGRPVGGWVQCGTRRDCRDIPDISVPMGFVVRSARLACFLLRPGVDASQTLIPIAYAYEQATRHRTAPTFAETLG